MRLVIAASLIAALLATAGAVAVALAAGEKKASDEQTAPAAQPAGEKLLVFVLAGQSNMQGSGEGAKLPAQLKAPQKDVLVFDGKGWQPLKPGGRFGPEVTFGRDMAKALGRPVGIIKFAVGGTNLAYNWHPKVAKNLYAKTLALVNAAKKSRPIEIAGMLWMQGERDSLFGGMAEKYAANLKELVTSARKDYEAPQMPFVLGRVNPPARYKFAGKVRKAQQEIAEPKTAWIDCDDLPKHRDNLHYNTQGQITLGERFAAAILKLMGKEAPQSEPAKP